MKKLLYLLLATPIIFLTSCSSGGGGDNTEPEPTFLFEGVWSMSALEVGGVDLMPLYNEGLTYVWPDGTIGVELILVDGTSSYSYGTYSLSSDQTSYTTEVTVGSGPSMGSYVSSTSSLSIINAEEMTASSYNDCLEVPSSGTSIKTTNSLSDWNHPAINYIIGVWERNSMMFSDVEVFPTTHSMVLDYFWENGQYGVEYYDLNGNLSDWGIGTHELSSNGILTITRTLSSIGSPSTILFDVNKFTANELNLYTPDYAGTGINFSSNAYKSSCHYLSSWKK